MKPVAEQRRERRYGIELPVHFQLGSGDVSYWTVTISPRGFSVILPQPPSIDAEVRFQLVLPDATTVAGQARCRNHRGGNEVGFSILPASQEDKARWLAFVAQEAKTGSLWRMVDRHLADDGNGDGRGVTKLADDGQFRSLSLGVISSAATAKAPTGRHEMRFHTVGENGEAYRIAFEKHASCPGIDSDLARSIPGFVEVAQRGIARILLDDCILRMSPRSPPIKARVVELNRGGYAYVQVNDEQVGLISLALGELILVSVNGESLFPHFSDDDLERIAYDTFVSDLAQPIFQSSKAPSNPTPLSLPDLAAAALPPDEPIGRTPTEQIRRAQSESSRMEERRYGSRVFHLFPEVWVRARESGSPHEVMGPSMRDGEHTLILVLVGQGAPRVLRVQDDLDIVSIQRR